MTIADKLIGKNIVSYKLSEDRESIIFYIACRKPYSGPQGKYHCEEEPVVLTVYGDCCSKSWIESLDAADNLLGNVINVEEIEMPDLGNIGTPHHESVDEVKYYGLKITTNKGICVIDYRNDSNGYYGGWIS